MQIDLSYLWTGHPTIEVIHTSVVHLRPTTYFIWKREPCVRTCYAADGGYQYNTTLVNPYRYRRLRARSLGYHGIQMLQGYIRPQSPASIHPSLVANAWHV